MKLVGKCVLFSLLAILGIGLLGLLLMTLWNWLVPELFNGPLIDYYKALGLLLLSKILFSGFGRCSKRCCKHRHRGWKGRLSHLTEEEKKHFKSKWKCWGSSCETDSEQKTE